MLNKSDPTHPLNVPNPRSSFRTRGCLLHCRSSMSDATFRMPFTIARVLVAAVFGIALVISPASAADQPDQDDLKRLSIEQLMQIDVTTAGRRAEPVGSTAAAISVITGDDIRRAGV